MPSYKPELGIEVPGTFLTPIRFSDSDNGTFFIYRCRCGNEKRIRKNNVKNRPKKTKSCGCLLKKAQEKFGKEAPTQQIGRTPWNKGLTGIKTSPLNHPSHKWKTGKIKMLKLDGSIDWVKVSDEKIGSDSKWYKLKKQLGIE
jgi:hypothetical protein|tara:strand:+ start:290 stop:718 length:429 start_codon:yes stop_codon:yes gene_type:complete